VLEYEVVAVMVWPRTRGDAASTDLNKAYTVKTARLVYHVNMEVTLLHSNPCGIFTN
jgi:hypothetical protein